jgi:hypothetical protein
LFFAVWFLAGLFSVWTWRVSFFCQECDRRMLTSFGRLVGGPLFCVFLSWP